MFFTIYLHSKYYVLNIQIVRKVASISGTLYHPRSHTTFIYHPGKVFGILVFGMLKMTLVSSLFHIYMILVLYWYLWRPFEWPADYKGVRWETYCLKSSIVIFHIISSFRHPCNDSLLKSEYVERPSNCIVRTLC